jgi:hypothetical protein
MTDNSLKVSELPQTTTLASSDRVMVLYNAANTSANASVRTITVNDFINSMYIQGPYANDPAAASAGISIGSLYYDISGLVHIRLV